MVGMVLGELHLGKEYWKKQKNESQRPQTTKKRTRRSPEAARVATGQLASSSRPQLKQCFAILLSLLFYYFLNLHC